MESRFYGAAHYNGEVGWALQKPKIDDQQQTGQEKEIVVPLFSHSDMVATRKAFGQGLVAIGKAKNLVMSLDAEVKNSTYAELFERAFPDRFVQCFVAEQNMVSMAVGLASRGKIPFVSTFSSFLTRAHDQLRMAAIGRSPLRVIGSHAGVSIGQDGPSQMGLEDIAMMRSLPNSVVLYSADAVSTVELLKLMTENDQSISYLRTTRANTPVIYDNHEQFSIGGCKVLRESCHDVASVIAAGITLFEALKAYELLKERGIEIAVIDLYSIKPLDRDTVLAVARSAHNRIITVEDHYPEGGIGEAILHALEGENISVTCLAVDKLPRSGKPEELLALVGIDADAIIRAVTKNVR
jgi:transketolase